MSQPETKRCPKCETTRPRTDFFSNKSRPDGLNGYCKLCIKADKAERFRKLKANPEKYRKYLESQYKWKREHKGFDTHYLATHRRKTWAGRATRVNESWNQKIKKFSNNKSLPNKVTGEQLEVLFEKFNKACAYCSNSLSISTVEFDHRIAISRGGSNFIKNLLPSCHKCNNKKKDKYWEIGHNV